MPLFAAVLFGHLSHHVKCSSVSAPDYQQVGFVRLATFKKGKKGSRTTAALVGLTNGTIVEIKPDNFVDNFLWTTALRHAAVTPVGDALINPASHVAYCKSFIDPKTRNVHVYGTREIFKKMRRDKQERERLAMKKAKDVENMKVPEKHAFFTLLASCF